MPTKRTTDGRDKRCLQSEMKFLITVLTAILLTAGANSSFAQSAPKNNQPVSLIDNGTNYTLDNGIVTVKIDKSSASIISYKYKNLELLGAMGIDGF